MRLFIALDLPREVKAALGACAAGLAGATLWLGVEKTPELCALHERLCRALRDRGFALEEREFRPHITLVREAARPAPETAAPEFALAVREAVLMESVRERGQLCYRPRYVQPL